MGLYAGEERIADCFYTGLPWEVGLKRFRRLLTARPLQPLRLRVQALRQDSAVYLERPPPFTGGKALALRSLVAWPQRSFLARRSGRGGVRISAR